VEVEVRYVDESGRVVHGEDVKLNLHVLDSSTLLPVQFQMNGSDHCGVTSICVGQGGYVKSDIMFDCDDVSSVGEVCVRACFEVNPTVFFDSEPTKLLKYRVAIRDVRLTDDISNYDGDGGVHYTNNDSARVKILYSVETEDGMVTDSENLATIHAEMNSQLLFANGERVQYVDSGGNLIDFTHIDCAVKRKNKNEEKKRVSKKVFEEQKRELSIAGEMGTVKASYRLNMFSSHQKLKDLHLDGRKYTIELSHSNAVAVSIPPIRILTKYHRPRKVKPSKENHNIIKDDIQTHIKEEKECCVKKENIENIGVPIKDEISACSTLDVKSEAPCHSNHHSHFLPFPSNHCIHSFPSHPTANPSFLEGKHQPLHLTRETCVEAARTWVNAYLTRTCHVKDAKKTSTPSKSGKSFRKAVVVKQDSRYKLKKPTVIRQKKRFVGRTQCLQEKEFLDEAVLHKDDDLRIVRSYMFGQTYHTHQDDVNLMSSEDYLDCVFSQDFGSSLASLDVPDISDKDLEPFLCSQELFVDFNLFE
jgi:hypothetical protein